MSPRSIVYESCREFVRGATEPSGVALTGAILIAAGILALCALLVTPRRLARVDPGYLMADGSDEDAKLTCNVLRIASGDSHERRLVIVGDSTIREAITSQDDLAKRVSEGVGFPVHVYLLVAGAVGLWDSVCITDCIRGHVDGLVVVEVSRFSMGANSTSLRQRVEDPRWPLHSSALKEEAARAQLAVPDRHHNYFLDHYRFFLARPAILFHAISGPVEAETHFYGGVRVQDENARAAEGAKLARWDASYRENRGTNLEAYARLVRRLREQPNTAVALLEGVESPAVKDSAQHESEVRAEYQQDIHDFAAKLPVQYWDLNRAARLRPGDFIDLVHLRNSEAQERYTEALATHAAAVLRVQFAPGKDAR